MNVVREINQINDKELQLGVSGASWHDEYKDSAYIFAGGLDFDLTEGDVITIFSQYGEIMDINMPRDKNTGKPRGFAFLMYEDQRSTVLAVDNLNGAKVLEKTLRVDHVRQYKQPRTKNAEGEWEDAEDQSFNAKPEMIVDEDAASESSESTGASIDPEDPMRDYLIAQRKEEKALKKSSKKSKSKSKGKDRKDETPEERRARKESKREKKARKATVAAGKSAGVRGVEELLQSLVGAPRSSVGRGGPSSRSRSRTPPAHRSRSRSPVRRRSPDYDRHAPRSRSPNRRGYERSRESSVRRAKFDDDDRRYNGRYSRDSR